MRRVFGALAVACALFGAASAQGAPRVAVDGSAADWRGKPTDLGGRTQLSRGELVYTDYLYDDYGADNDSAPGYPAFRDQLAPVSGDYRYPAGADRYGYNSADLRELRVRSTRKGLRILLALQTLKQPSAGITMLALDTDGKASTGADVWPDAAGITGTPGADRFVTLWGRRGGRVSRADGRSSKVRQRTSARNNVIEAFVPRARLGRLSRRTRVWAITGLNGGDGRFAQQSPGRAAAFDVAFQGAETYDALSQWGDKRQSTALADGNLTEFAQTFDPVASRRGRSRPFRVTPGFYNRIFRSKYTYGEGIRLKKNDSGNPSVDVAGRAEPMFLGRYQPYGLYVPTSWKPGAKTPLTINGHSLDVNQNQYQAIGAELPALGEARGSLVITPLARGTDTWYLDAGLADVIEAWDDVKRTFSADPERTALTGYSMGGYLTYRLGLLRPDAFTRASVYVGPIGYYNWPFPAPLQSTDEWRVRSFTNLIVGNGLNLPYEIVHGNLDELVPVSGVVEQADTFRRLGNPYRFYQHQADDHLSFIAAGNFARTREWLGGPDVRRDLSPVRVRYRRYPSMDLPQYGLKWDRAYWVADLEVRSAGAEDSFGEVDATTFGRGGARRVARAEPVRVEPPGVGVSPGVVRGQELVDGEPIVKRNGFEASLVNLSALRIVSGRAGLVAGEPLEATLRGDGRTVLTLDGEWSTATLDGAAVPLARRDGRTALTLDLAPGATRALKLR